jgi:hypothetical protein
VLVRPAALCGAAIASKIWVSSLLDGLCKVEYGVNDAFGRSVMCMHAGKMLGGNSAFADLEADAARIVFSQSRHTRFQGFH